MTEWKEALVRLPSAALLEPMAEGVSMITNRAMQPASTGVSRFPMNASWSEKDY